VPGGFEVRSRVTQNDGIRSRPMRKLFLVGSLVAAAALITMNALPAGAAVTIGQTFTPNSGCGGDTFFQQASLTQPYSAPFSGVITSWAFQADSAPPPVKFKVGRPIGGNDYTIIGASPSVNPTPDVLNTNPTRISVQAGDQIGFFTGTGNCAFEDAPAGNLIVFFTADLSPGATTTFEQQDERLLDVSAILEPDADNDGFGDETQDKCVGTAGAFNGCPNALTLGKVKQKGTKPKLKVTATVPGAGTLSAGSPNDPVLAATAAKNLKPVTQTLTSTRSHTVTLTLKLTKSAKRKLADKDKLKLQVKLVYTPLGGPPGSRQKKAKLRT
jgi:hypothetical protein